MAWCQDYYPRRAVSHPQPEMLTKVLARPKCLFPLFLIITQYFILTMRPPSRVRGAVTFYDDAQAKGDETIKKMRDKTAKKRRINPLNPIPVEPLPASLNEAYADPLPAFHPPFSVEYESLQYPFTQRSPLNTFLLFFTFVIFDIIIVNINSKVINWRPQPL